MVDVEKVWLRESSAEATLGAENMEVVVYMKGH